MRKLRAGQCGKWEKKETRKGCFERIKKGGGTKTSPVEKKRFWTNPLGKPKEGLAGNEHSLGART